LVRQQTQAINGFAAFIGVGVIAGVGRDESEGVDRDCTGRSGRLPAEGARLALTEIADQIER